jgi:multidrug efflux pump subunit AcrA (membrane-fusion protein)
MSTAAVKRAPAPEIVPQRSARRRRRLLKGLILFALIAAPLALGGWAAWRAYKSIGVRGPSVPVASVKRGDVTFTVTATGQLQGGNPDILTAPMTGGGEMRIKTLSKPGDIVKAGDVVVEFDTTDQSFRLKEAEADLAEAEQQVLKAKAESEAVAEENSYLLLKAKSDVKLAELEVRRNPLVSTITARQNELALEAARDHLAQLEHDLGNRSASSQASIEIQEAARSKAKTLADTARRNIEQMTVKARNDGYVSVRQNTRGNGMYYTGMSMPLFRVGDRAYPGMAIAEIPDLKHWELVASVGELDRGHVAVGQNVAVHVIALPFRQFHAKVKNIGGTTGAPWDRHFECRMTLEDPSPDLRPGMNAELVITTEVMNNVLSIPGQALFEADGRTFVYVPSGSGFAPRDVKLVRRSESQVVITGLPERQSVALASPDEQTKKQSGGSSAMKAIPK